MTRRRKTGSERFEAYSAGPPERKMYILANALVPPGSPPHMVSGWEIVIDQKDKHGSWEPLWDTWEETFARALLYPPEYLSGHPQWFDREINEPADLHSLEFEE